MDENNQLNYQPNYYNNVRQFYKKNKKTMPLNILPTVHLLMPITPCNSINEEYDNKFLNFTPERIDPLEYYIKSNELKYNETLMSLDRINLESSNDNDINTDESLMSSYNISPIEDCTMIYPIENNDAIYKSLYDKLLDKRSCHICHGVSNMINCNICIASICNSCYYRHNIINCFNCSTKLM